MSTSAPTQELHFVIGGAGFLGSYIARALVARGETAVASFDLREPVERLKGVHYYTGDLTDRDSLARAIALAHTETQGSGAEKRTAVIYHTASPVAGLGPEVYEKVNVQGTETVIAVAKEPAVRVAKLVFTSSAGVVFDGHNLNYVDERMPYPKKPLDSYNDTKVRVSHIRGRLTSQARAEKAVLEANDPSGLATVSLRPAGIFGPGDRQALPGFFNVLSTGRTKFQVGNNENLFDWTYVENVAHAHLLAADRLPVHGAAGKPEYAYEASDLAVKHLPLRVLGEEERDLYRTVPISPRRQDVPPTAKDYARGLQTVGAARLEDMPGLDVRPVFRNRFDQFFHHAHPGVACGGNPMPDVHNFSQEKLGIAGEAFFITNGQPIAFWDFPRALWYRYNGHVVPREQLWVIGLQIALVLAFLAECFSFLTRRPVQFTRYRVTYTACARYYNIEKARRLLGYEPLVGMDEAITRSVAWWKQLHPPERPGESKKTQ